MPLEEIQQDRGLECNWHGRPNKLLSYAMAPSATSASLYTQLHSRLVSPRLLASRRRNGND